MNTKIKVSADTYLIEAFASQMEYVDKIKGVRKDQSYYKNLARKVFDDDLSLAQMLTDEQYFVY